MPSISGQPRPAELLLSLQNLTAEYEFAEHVDADAEEDAKQRIIASIPAEYRAGFTDPTPTFADLTVALCLAETTEHRVSGLWAAITSGLPRRPRMRYSAERVSAVTADGDWMLINPWVLAAWAWHSARDGKTPFVYHGLLSHEVAHMLYSPMGRDAWGSDARGVVPDEMLSHANILEDGRIETLLSREYPHLGSYLLEQNAALFSFIRDDPQLAASYYPYLSSIEHAPDDLIEAAGAIYELVFGTEQRQRLDEIKKEYIGLGRFVPGDAGEKRALELVLEFIELIGVEVSAHSCSRMVPGDSDADAGAGGAAGASRQVPVSSAGNQSGDEDSGNPGGDDTETEEEDSESSGEDGNDSSSCDADTAAADALPEIPDGTAGDMSEDPDSGDASGMIPQELIDALNAALDNLENSYSDTDLASNLERRERREKNRDDPSPLRATPSGNWAPEPMPENGKGEWARLWYPKEQEIRRMLTDKSRTLHQQPRGRIHMRSVRKQMPRGGENYRARLKTADRGHGQLEIVTGFDVSGSVNYKDVETLSRCMTHIKRICDNLRIPASVIAWSEKRAYMYGPEDRAQPSVVRTPDYGVSGSGTLPEASSVKSMEILRKSQKKHKLYLNMTDGNWGSGRDQPLIDEKPAVGCSAHLVLFGMGYSPDNMPNDATMRQWEGYDTIGFSDTAEGVAELFLESVRECVQSTRAGRFNTRRTPAVRHPVRTRTHP